MAIPTRYRRVALTGNAMWSRPEPPARLVQNPQLTALPEASRDTMPASKKTPTSRGPIGAMRSVRMWAHERPRSTPGAHPRTVAHPPRLISRCDVTSDVADPAEVRARTLTMFGRPRQSWSQPRARANRRSPISPRAMNPAPHRPCVRGPGTPPEASRHTKLLDVVGRGVGSRCITAVLARADDRKPSASTLGSLPLAVERGAPAHGGGERLHRSSKACRLPVVACVTSIREGARGVFHPQHAR